MINRLIYGIEILVRLSRAKRKNKEGKKKKQFLRKKSAVETYITP